MEGEGKGSEGGRDKGGVRLTTFKDLPPSLAWLAICLAVSLLLYCACIFSRLSACDRN